MGTLEIFTTLVYAFTMRGNNSHTRDFHTLVNFATQCGENRHTNIANFATLIDTKKINTPCGDFYHTIW